MKILSIFLIVHKMFLKINDQCVLGSIYITWVHFPKFNPLMILSMSWFHVSLKCNPYVINFDDQRSQKRVNNHWLWEQEILHAWHGITDPQTFRMRFKGYYWDEENVSLRNLLKLNEMKKNPKPKVHEKDSFIGVWEEQNSFSSSVHYHRAKHHEQVSILWSYKGQSSPKGSQFLQFFQSLKVCYCFSVSGFVENVWNIVALCCFLRIFCHSEYWVCFSLSLKKKKKKRLLGLFLVLWIDGFCIHIIV